MIRNIFARIFPTTASELEPITTDKPATQSMGISTIPDSFESAASKYSSEFDLGLGGLDAAKKQQELLKEKQRLSEQQKKLEEAAKEAADNSGSFWGGIASFFGDDKGTVVDYQTQKALETYSQAEQSSQRIAERVNSTDDDIKKNLG